MARKFVKGPRCAAKAKVGAFAHCKLYEEDSVKEQGTQVLMLEEELADNWWRAQRNIL